MSNGWISLHRQFLEWEWYDDINTKCLFIHLLLIANHKDAKWRGKTIKRGQRFLSIKNISNDLNLSQKQIRTSLGKLKKTGEIGTQGESNGTLVTIINYDTYQNMIFSEGKQKVNQETIRGKSKVKQRATNNNNNKIDNKNKIKRTTDLRSEIYSEKNIYKYGKEMLEEFYLFYSEPTQDGKQMKFQTFKTWSTSGRLATWSKKDFNGCFKMHTDEQFRRNKNQPEIVYKGEKIATEKERSDILGGTKFKLRSM